MAIDTPQFRNADTMTGGRLEQILAEMVAAGRAPEHMVRVLYAEHKVEVSRATVVRWIAQLASDPEPNGDQAETKAS